MTLTGQALYGGKPSNLLDFKMKKDGILLNMYNFLEIEGTDDDLIATFEDIVKTLKEIKESRSEENSKTEK